MRWLGLGRDPLERFVLAIALGRVLLAVVSLASVSTVGPIGIHALAIAGPIAWWLTRHRVQRDAAPVGMAGPIAVAIAAALVLVFTVVGRVGLPAADGTLLFPASDATRDPLVYASLALRLYESGLPVSYPFTSGATTTTTYLPYGVMIGLHAMGASMLDVATRVVPIAEATGLAISAVALVRALGHSRGAAALAGVLVVLGGEPSYWIGPLTAPFGLETQTLATWSFFGPFLFAFNPVTPALQMVFAALLLVAALPSAPERAADRTRNAIAAGAIVALLFETKVFLWAPVVGGIALLAFVAPPPALARALRLTAVVAILGSLPFLAEKLAWARALSGRDLTAFVACPGCLPRYLADAAIGSHDLSLRSFEAFRWEMLASPAAIAKTGLAVALTLAVALGARAAALPQLWRGARDADPALASVHRWIGLAAALGLGAATVFTTRPHYLNGLQFAWIATGGLWPFAAIAIARWIDDRRRLRVFAVALLVLPGSWASLAVLGAGQPATHRVPPDEMAFVQELGDIVPDDEFVLEPSILIESDFPTPVTWQAGRSVFLSLMSAAKILPRDELLRRRDLLVAVFGSSDRDRALAAVAATGAQWLYAPSAVPLRFEPGPALEVVSAGPTGTLYRVAR